jgi:hypothetical protein
MKQEEEEGFFLMWDTCLPAPPPPPTLPPLRPTHRLVQVRSCWSARRHNSSHIRDTDFLHLAAGGIHRYILLFKKYTCAEDSSSSCVRPFLVGWWGGTYVQVTYQMYKKKKLGTFGCTVYAGVPCRHRKKIEILVSSNGCQCRNH